MKKVLITLLCSVFSSAVWSAGMGLDSSNPDTIANFISNSHWLIYFMSFFLLGILLAFTPCVLPMIPILSGIITGQRSLSSHRAFWLSLSYVLGMATVYAIAGMCAGYLGSTVQTILQKPSVIIGFSIVFVGMALSLLGLYELPLFSFNQKSGQSTQSKGLLSVALMGGLSALIVSPCVTAPLLGVLAFISHKGQMFLGGAILFVMALGMGIPLIIFGAGYGSLLPKTGVWMVRVRQLVALMMIAIAAWMVARVLPNAHPHIHSPFTVVYSIESLKQQLEQAKIDRHPVFIEFAAGWCSDCQAMDNKVFNQADILDAMHYSTNIRVDISAKDPEVARIKAMYGIYGIPTMMFYCQDGQAQPNITSVGQIDKNKMMSLLQQFQKQC